MDNDILKDYRNNILKRFDTLIKEIEHQYYETPNIELKVLLDKAENDFYEYCEKYSVLVDEYLKK